MSPSQQGRQPFEKLTLPGFRQSLNARKQLIHAYLIQVSRELIGNWRQLHLFFRPKLAGWIPKLLQQLFGCVVIQLLDIGQLKVAPLPCDDLGATLQLVELSKLALHRLKQLLDLRGMLG